MTHRARMTEDGLRAGDLLGSRYRLIDRIGAGGMSVIWRARDETLDRLVAVKVLDPRLAHDDRLRELARREAWTAARLDHPDVASVHDFVRCQRAGREVAIIVLQLVPGEPLAERIAAGPMPWREALRIGGRVATVLSVAHRAAVVHRDITPDNIMIYGGKVTVLDFGIAARVGEPDDDSTGATFGTPAYVAPERLDGTPAQTATDMYALGVVLYEMLTGTVPFPVYGWADVAVEHGEPATVVVPGMPRTVTGLITRCLRRDPRERPQATEAVMVLRRAETYQPGRWLRRGAAAVAVVATATTTAATWTRVQDGTPVNTPQRLSAAVSDPPAAVVPPGAPAPTTGPPTRDEALATALATVDTARLRDDVALDLRQVIRNLTYDAGTPAQVEAGHQAIQRKISTRERDHDIAADAATRLRGDVRRLADALIRQW
jgi:hypothetical protein